MKFDKRPNSSAAEVPAKFQYDQAILNTNLAALGLHRILW